MSESANSISAYEKQLKEVNKQIDNIVNAIANGLFHKSLKAKMLWLK
jgi:hypothetical protein